MYFYMANYNLKKMRSTANQNQPIITSNVYERKLRDESMAVPKNRLVLAVLLPDVDLGNAETIRVWINGDYKMNNIIVSYYEFVK